METQKDTSFKLFQGLKPNRILWHDHAKYFDELLGISSEHYWFQKVEYLL